MTSNSEGRKGAAKSSDSKSAKQDKTKAAQKSQAPFGLGLLTLVLALAYVLPGLTGHDVWSAGEARTMEIVGSMIDDADVVVPTADGAPALDYGPAYYITAAGIAGVVLGAVPLPEQTAAYLDLDLPLHDAARLATGLYVLILFGFTLLLGRAAWVRDGRNQGEGAIALLVLIGTLGLFLSAHYMVPDVALSAAVAMAVYGLSIAPRRVFWGGVWLGTGVGLAFLTKGLLAPMFLVASMLVLPLFGRGWRSGRYLRAILLAVIAAAPWLLIWPWFLYQRDPALLQAWLWDHNLNHYLGLYLSGAAPETPPSMDFWLRTWPWVTFPAAILAVLTLFIRLGEVLRSDGLRATLVVSIVGWAALLFSQAAEPVYALPLLAPLAVIGAGSVRALPRWLVRPVHLVSFLLFGAAAVVLWLLWGYHMFNGQPFQSDLLPPQLPRDFAFAWQPIAFALAAALTLLWCWIALRFRHGRPAALLIWPAGIVLVWGLVSLLHLPWVDAGQALNADAPAAAAVDQPAPGSFAVADAAAVGS